MDGNQILAGLLISTVGFGFFLYGKKQSRAPQLVGGLLLMGYPYVVPGLLPTIGVGGLIMLLMYVAIRAGL